MSTPCSAVELVTFDVGGTLLMLVPDQPRAWAEVLAETGVAVDLDRLRAAFTQERPEAARRRAESVPPDHQVSVEAGTARRRTFVENVLQNAGVASDALEEAVTVVRAALDSPRMYVPYDDALPTLRELWLRGLKLGAVSNTWPSMPKILLAYGFGEYLGFWVVSEFFGVEKPDPAIFERALEIGGAEPGRAVHVGDQIDTDVEGARAAGMDAVLLDRNGRPVPEDLGVPVISRLTQLLTMIG